jgi:tetratricopeptide (TPR) repeat protein
MSISDRDSSPLPTSTIEKLKRFTDRHTLTRYFVKHIHTNPTPEKILYFQGAGGNGKSFLLDFLRIHCCKKLPAGIWLNIQHKEKFSKAILECADCDSFPVIQHDFAVPDRDADRPLDPYYGLLMLRRNLARAAQDCGYRVTFPLFDFACLWYLRATDRLTEDKVKELFPADSLDILQETINLIKEIPGIGFARILLDIFNRKTAEWFTLYKAKYGLQAEDITQIQRLDPERELINELPRFLARDLNLAMEQKHHPSRLILLFDTHEKFWDERRQERGEKYFNLDEWLRYFLRELELTKGIIVVVAGREAPRWVQATRYPIPAEFLEICDVSNFAREDAAEYLENSQISDTNLIQAMIDYASVPPGEVHPLFLGMCGDVVAQAKARNAILTANDFISQVQAERKPQELLERLLRYVDRYIADGVYALSACRSFDFELYRYLGEKLHFNATRTDFDILKGFSFVQQDGNNPNRYRLHALLCRLHDETANPLTREAHTVLEAYYREQNNLPEAIYQANRLDWERGINEWCEVFDRALQESRYENCRAMLAVREGLNIFSYFQLARVSEREGEFYSQLSRHEEAQQEYLEAIYCYQADLENSPEDTATLNNLGIALQSLGDLQSRLSLSSEALESYQSAIASYATALGLAPNYIYAHNNKGLALRRLGELQSSLSLSSEALESYQNAIAAYNTALGLAPNDISAHNNKGLALQSLGELQSSLSLSSEALESYQNAIAAYNTALGLAPNYISAHNNKGLALQSLGELQSSLSLSSEALDSYQNAIAAYNTALGLAPNDISAHNNKGNALRSLGDLQSRLSLNSEALESYQNAIASYDTALGLAPNDISAHNNKGNALRSLGDLQSRLSLSSEALESYQNAIAAYNTALELAPNYVYALNNLGRALINLADLYINLSEPETARECFDYALAALSRSLEIAPNDSYIRSLYDDLAAFLQGEGS